jgi:hypothetical protein
MQESNKIIQANLNSNDPVVIQTAIQYLKERMDKFNEFEMHPFGLEILTSFGETISKETQINFLKIIREYRSFVPKLSEEDQIAIIIALVLGYAERYVAFQVALELKISTYPVRAIKIAMGEIARQGLLSPKNIKGAAYLVSRLLDGKDEVRKATLQSLNLWPAETPYLEVMEYIKPQLESDELELIQRK